MHTYIFSANNTKIANTKELLTVTIQNTSFSLEQRFSNCYCQPLGLLGDVPRKGRKPSDWAAWAPPFLKLSWSTFQFYVLGLLVTFSLNDFCCT